MLTALTFALILTSAVVVHELAHYFNARSVGIQVRAFSVGIGPVLARKTWRGTEWRLSLLPLGGYVDLPGMGATVDEDGTVRPPTEGMAKLRLGPKLWVLIGGVIANYILGSVLLAGAIALQPGYRAITSGTEPVIEGSRIGAVVPGSHAAELGLAPHDRLLAINGVTDPTPDQVIAQVQSADHLDLTVERNSQQLTFSIPWPPAGEDAPLLGIEIGAVVAPVSFFAALPEAAAFGIRVIPEMVRGFVSGLGSAVTGSANADVAGPVGMVGLVNQATQVGVAPVLLLAAIINFSLGVFNLLPIPGLDGGRMLLATVVSLRGRPFRPGQEEQIHFIGVMLVMAFIVLITFRELSALFTG